LRNNDDEKKMSKQRPGSTCLEGKKEEMNPLTIRTARKGKGGTW